MCFLTSVFKPLDGTWMQFSQYWHFMQNLHLCIFKHFSWRRFLKFFNNSLTKKKKNHCKLHTKSPLVNLTNLLYIFDTLTNFFLPPCSYFSSNFTDCYKCIFSWCLLSNFTLLHLLSQICTQIVKVEETFLVWKNLSCFNVVELH